MASATIIAVVLLACVRLFAGIMMGAAYLRQRVPWEPLEGFEGVRVHDLSGLVDRELLRDAVRAAVDALLRYSDFEPERVRGLTRDLSIAVQRVESWHAMDGTQVGGLAQGRTVYIGPSLSALLHEAAHVLEMNESNFPDYRHSQWGTRGIWAADNAYRAKLGELSRARVEGRAS